MPSVFLNGAKRQCTAVPDPTLPHHSMHDNHELLHALCINKLQTNVHTSLCIIVNMIHSGKGADAVDVAAKICWQELQNAAREERSAGALCNRERMGMPKLPSFLRAPAFCSPSHGRFCSPCSCAIICTDVGVVQGHMYACQSGNTSTQCKRCVSMPVQNNASGQQGVASTDLRPACAERKGVVPS